MVAMRVVVTVGADGQRGPCPFKRRHEGNEKDIKQEREERHHGREALHFRTKENHWKGVK